MLPYVGSSTTISTMAALSLKRAAKGRCGSLLPLILALALILYHRQVLDAKRYALILYHRQVLDAKRDGKYGLRNGGNQGNIRAKHHPRESDGLDQASLTDGDVRLDFFVAGFPKCGTTTLLHSFLNHNETMIAPHEFCEMDKTAVDPETRLEKLNELLANMPARPELLVRRGIKCPMAVWNSRGIQLISSAFEHTRIVIGLRHPVLLFESFYNYRVTEMYDKMKVETPPSPLELVGNKWRDVSTDLTRYELSLMQLGKTPLTSLDLSDLGAHEKILSPTKLEVFLYSIEQLNDADEGRARNFRSDLQTFLRLENPIEPFPMENSNRVKRKESIDICDRQYNGLRRLLTEQGKNTARWIRDDFLKSEDVFVGGRNHFDLLLDSWEHDPCLKFARATNFNGRPVRSVPSARTPSLRSPGGHH